jgi:hypothetical protein
MKTPGVYIDELNSFPNSVVPVATAVPAFIGYTPKASYQGKSYSNEPVKITSLQEFQSYFCIPDPVPPTDPAKQYAPDYHLVKEIAQPTKGDWLVINNDFYSIVPDPSTIYYLVNSMHAFFCNGGGEAFIVSVGTYGQPSGVPMPPGGQIINPNVQLEALQKGLKNLKPYNEPTLYICPEATLLAPAENELLMQSMLEQSNEMQTAMSIFDIIGARNPDPATYGTDIENFRNSVGTKGLKFSAAYYPFLESVLMRNFDYQNLNGGDVAQFKLLLSPSYAPNVKVEKILEDIQSNTLSVSEGQKALIMKSATYNSIYTAVLKVANVLPPSAFMAGIYTNVDNSEGVWKAPAGITPNGASNLTINLTDEQQSSLTVDATAGKSINCIRSFYGRGILVWGARTLDGNSQDWRYISVRRTVTFLEQSCKIAVASFQFSPNNQNTWQAVISTISSFLTGIWQQGGLQGAKAADAFSVQVGLGTTMTSDDLQNGRMVVSVKVAVTHPAEFIVISFEQEMSVA